MPFTTDEKKHITSMSMLMGLRMIGVSFIIPILSIYATEGFPGSSGILAGIAVGIFGLSQVIFQVPMGRLSDRRGRKTATLLGLGIYIIGTVLSGASHSIYHLIAARVIAGAGAVSGVTMAWLTEGVRVNRRNSAISYVDIAIVFSQVIGFILSPIIAARAGMAVVFYLSAGLALAAFFFTLFSLTNGSQELLLYEDDSFDIRSNHFREIIHNRDMIKLCIIGFTRALARVSIFFIMPILIKEQIGLVSLWKIMVPPIIVGAAAMYYFGRMADIHGTKQVALLALVLEVIGLTLPLLSMNIIPLSFSFLIFFAGNSILAPVLPAAVSRYPGDSIRGTVMSLFNSSQFIGFAVGGFISGIMLKLSVETLLIVLIGLVVIAGAALLRFNDFQD